MDFGRETPKFRFEFCRGFLGGSFPSCFSQGKRPEKFHQKIPRKIHPGLCSEKFPSDFCSSLSLMVFFEWPPGRRPLNLGGEYSPPLMRCHGLAGLSKNTFFLRTSSTTARDRNLQFRGAVSTGGSPLDFLLFLQYFHVQFSKTSPLKSGESSEKSSGENRVKPCHVCGCHGFFGPDFRVFLTYSLGSPETTQHPPDTIKWTLFRCSPRG